MESFFYWDALKQGVYMYSSHMYMYYTSYKVKLHVHVRIFYI